MVLENSICSEANFTITVFCTGNLTFSENITLGTLVNQVLQLNIVLLLAIVSTK